MLPKPHYPEVDPNPDFPKIEEHVLAFWQKEGIFERSVESRPAVKDGKNNEFVFYDGPPFANGLPHYGHLLTGFVKDVIARYQTMKGKRVERRFGWDCHGLPAEMGSEKELGISGRQAIIRHGIDKFNEHCRTSVMKYTQEWEYYVNRQARWVDFKNDYKTMDINFMESVLWAFKQLYDKGLIFEAYRVMPYSWPAETPLSNFETKLDNSYREREDKAITVAFELNTPPHGAPKADKYYVLAWTTTPWTLPSNLALAVNKETEYAYIRHSREGENPVCYIIGANAAARYGKELGDAEGKISVDSCLRGNDLLGLSYRPLFPYFASHKHSFRILDGSHFVTDADGTGIVHMAPGFGEDDQKLCEASGIEIVVPVDGQGKFTEEIYDIEWPVVSGQRSGENPATGHRPLATLSLKGLNVIAEPGGSKFGLANDRIIDYLKAAGQLIKQEQIKHNYPHCWRTDQPLIYRAMPSWYVEVTKFRDRAAEINKNIDWIPSHVRDGQMGHMLSTAPDWSISRNRFWGTPIPVWRSKSGKIKVFGSIKDIEDAWNASSCGERSESAGSQAMAKDPAQPFPGSQDDAKKITDLHRPYIDEIVIVENGEEYRRVEDVFDCWFESGSMPFAQVHYPFENKDWFETHFPADFITEYVGQTRGWFNTLIMLSTALFDKNPFEHCICHGVVLDSETGLKYSKRLKNYKDPKEVMDKFGADALRWLMLSSPVMRGQDLMVDAEGKFIRDVVRLAIKPIWNAYNFFCLYANADSISCGPRSGSTGSHVAEKDSALTLRVPQNVMDRYILAKCRQAVEQIRASFDAYDTPGACDAVMQFFEVLNNWYIRRNKERFWKHEQDADKQAAYDTLYTALTAMCRAGAPLLPLTLEEIYQGLTGELSVHLADFPTVILSAAKDLPKQGDSSATPQNDRELMTHMDRVRDACNAALAIRNRVNIRVRQPLSMLTFVGKGWARDERWAAIEEGGYLPIVRDEVNVKDMRVEPDITHYATLKLSINNPVLGKRLPEKMKQIIPASKKGEWKQVDGTVEICGEKLLPGEYALQLEPKPEYKDRAQALSTNDALVILDTTVTPELEAEGIARDVVRMVQQARKDAALNVSDRIRLHIAAPDSISRAINAHRDYLMEQTLSIELAARLDNPTFSAENTLDGQKIVIALTPTAA